MFFAYSSIVQSGFLAIGVSTCQLSIFHAVFSYNFNYLLCNIIIFIILILFQTIKSNPLFVLSDLFCLRKNNMLMAITFTICIFSLAGVPPTFGFFTKLFFIQMLIQENFEITAIIILLLSTISLYYYINIIRNI